jgi:signal transduction histidine kinase
MMADGGDRNRVGHPSRTEVALVVAVLAAGAALTVGLAGAVGMDASTTAELLEIAAGAALVTAAVGALVLFVLRRRSLTLQTGIIAVASVGSVAIGAAAAASQMFLTHHDLNALVVILAPAATVGVVSVLVLGWRVRAATKSLRDAAQRIGDGDLRAPIERPGTAEFADLASELQAMAARLDESLTRERAAEESRRDLVAWISHDLRTPLAAIAAVTEALEDGVISEPADVAAYYRTLRVETARLSAMIDDLFELSRINAGTVALELRRVSLDELISEAMDAAAPVASARQVLLRRSVSGPDGCGLMASAPELSRALSNILHNAIRHTPTGGSVRVDAGVADGTAFVSVQDECGGIAADDLDRVFDPAFRGEPARTPTRDGSRGAGLGLTIARGMVEAHQGRISVVNAGPGCRFVMTLPAGSAAAGGR